MWNQPFFKVQKNTYFWKQGQFERNKRDTFPRKTSLKLP